LTLLAPLALLLGLLLRPFVRPKPSPRTALRAPWLPILGAALEVGLVRAGFPLAGEAAVYALALAWLYLHKASPWYPIALLGVALNLWAILLHGGMPVDPNLVERLSLPTPTGAHRLGEAFPLGDWIPLLGRAVSPGDLAILLALVVLAATAWIPAPEKEVRREGAGEEQAPS